jgi:MFS family permease
VLTHIGSQLSIPRYGVALIEALHLKNGNCQKLAALDQSEWQKLLALCDSSQLTLLLRHYCNAALPENVRTRVDKNFLDNAARFQRLNKALGEIADYLTIRSIDFCLLKGFAHSPEFTPDPLLRVQGDIDLWCLPSAIHQAQQALHELGYRPFGKSKGRHLDPMIHETEQWQWRGDYFARDLPIPVDLHFSLWDEELELIPGPDEPAWWNRRVSMPFAGGSISQLGTADSLTFAVLHFMMHLLHGDPRLQRAWEIAHFLGGRASDTSFWLDWQRNCSPRMLQFQVIAFDLVRQWFGCDLSPLVESCILTLPSDASLWLQRYGFSPIEGIFAPNKDELWLNLCLLDSTSAKTRVLFRRLLPVPHLGNATTTQDAEGASVAMRFRFLLRRSGHHVRTLHSTGLRGLEWFWIRWRPGPGFSTFLLVSVLFDFGEFVFFLLYNLYLIERKLDVKFIGQVASMLTAGSFAGVLPASAIVRRFGLRNAVMLAVVGTATAATLRSLAASPSALLGTAFMNGVFLSLWAVLLPPAVAGLTDERHRTLGFSLITSIGIGTGALAGLLGGRLPSTLLHLYPVLTSIRAKQSSLLAGSAVAALAIVPAALLPVSALPRTPREKRIYPNNSFVRAFLAALFIWTLGTAGFNPFFNVYFSKHLNATVQQVGLISTCSQLAQVAAILTAPAFLRKVGDVRGIVVAQFATALALGLLAFATNRLLGALLFAAYMSFQYMSEPCLFSMLMTRVDRAEQTGASALNFLTTSLAGILAAAIAGASMSRAGYSVTLAVCAGVIAVAAAVFGLLVRR